VFDLCLSAFIQSYDTELLLPRDSVSVPVQPVVVVKSESEPSPISFMGALRIPVSNTFTARVIVFETMNRMLI